MKMREIYFSLGSNLGGRAENLCRAIDFLYKGLNGLSGLEVSNPKVSSFMDNPAWGFESDDNFMNCVVSFEVLDRDNPDSESSENPVFTEDFALKVLRLCKDIESSMGRNDVPEYNFQGQRIYHSRLIDIDILFIGGLRMDTFDLTIPHKGMEERDFVMIPLGEIVSPQIMVMFPEIFEKK